MRACALTARWSYSVFEPVTSLERIVGRYGRTHVIVGNADCRILAHGVLEHRHVDRLAGKRAVDDRIELQLGRIGDKSATPLLLDALAKPTDRVLERRRVAREVVRRDAERRGGLAAEVAPERRWPVDVVDRVVQFRPQGAAAAMDP